jgi:hypothetical protein
MLLREAKEEELETQPGEEEVEEEEEGEEEDEEVTDGTDKIRMGEDKMERTDEMGEEAGVVVEADIPGGRTDRVAKTEVEGVAVDTS